MKRAIYVIFFTYLSCIFFCIPAYFSFTIKPRDVDEVCFNESFCDMDFLNLKETSFAAGDIINTYSNSLKSLTDSEIKNLSNKLEKNNLNNFIPEIIDKRSQNNGLNAEEKIKNLSIKKLRTIRFDEEANANSVLSTNEISDPSQLMNESDIFNKSVNEIDDRNYILEYGVLINKIENDEQNNKLQQSQPVIRNYSSMIMKFDKIFGEMQSKSKVKLNYIDQLQMWLKKKEFLENFSSDTKITTWRVTFSDVALMNNGWLKKINFWVYSVLNKIIPCCALTYLSLALIRMLYQSNERRHRLRGSQQQRFYSQAVNSSFYNVNPIQNALPVEIMNSISAQKNKKNNENNYHAKSLSNLQNLSNQSLSNQNFSDLKKRNHSNSELSNNSKLIKINASLSSDLISKMNLGTFPIIKNKLKFDKKKNQSNKSLHINSCKDEMNENFELNSNQSLNHPLNLSSRNSNASYIQPLSFINVSSSYSNPLCKINNNPNCDRTTKMLLAILFLFLITEIPSGILSFLAGILGEVFLNNVYNNLGEVMDLLALINNGVNFILYCIMSRQFRKAFQKTFYCGCINYFTLIVSQSVHKSKNIKTNDQLYKKKLSTNKKIDSLSQEICEDNIYSNEKVLSEIDDQKSIATNVKKAKRNNTIEIVNDCMYKNENNWDSSKLMKSLFSEQGTIIKYKENCLNVLNLKHHIERNYQNHIEKSSSKKNPIGDESIKSNYAKQSALNEFIENGSVIKNRSEIFDNEARFGDKSTVKNNLINPDIKSQIHCNLSIVSICDQSNRRSDLLHRFNDNRKRRRKRIANMHIDYKKSSFSTCV